MIEKLVTNPSKLTDLLNTIRVKNVNFYDLMEDIKNGLHDTANSLDEALEEWNLDKYPERRDSLREDMANVYTMLYLLLIKYSMHMGDEFGVEVDKVCDKLMSQYGFSLEEVKEINQLNEESENYDSLEF